ncbi:MAG: LamG domain-containing protein [Chloroflexi bacterium]|nr:LamG domain-containing protein [Chloroflexota bacterium]
MASAVIATLLLLPAGSPVRAAPAVTADYQFQDTLESDAGDAASLTGLGPTSFMTDTVDGRERTVLAFEEGSGLALERTGGVLAGNTYSIVVLFRFDTTTSWRRIVDLSNAASDSGLYSYYGALQFYPLTPGPEEVITPGRYVQVVLTRDSGGNIAGYVDGVQQISFVDTDNLAIPGGDGPVRFFRDDVGVPNEHSAGAVARIRVFDGALTPAEVAALDR